MKDWAKELYLSKSWLAVRDYIYEKEYGLCQRCGNAGEIVHHRIYLTPSNINDINITLNPDNLELLCRECHAREHEGTSSTEQGLIFNGEGELIDIKNIHE